MESDEQREKGPAWRLRDSIDEPALTKAGKWSASGATHSARSLQKSLQKFGAIPVALVIQR